MKISYKELKDKMTCEIYLEETFLGFVRLHVYKQRWYLDGNFKIPHHVKSDDMYDSWYSAGKKLAQLYRSWGRTFSKPAAIDEIDFGVDLDDIVSFLKLRR